MASEQFANNAATTLSGNGGSITSGATSFIVANASQFPASGNFRVIIGSEIIIVGAVSGTTFSSCTRGAENTTAAAHNDGDAVTCILTAGVLSILASRPIVFSITGGGNILTTGVKTDLYIPIDCTITANTMLADQSGSCVVDIWKVAYASFPPTNANSICASAKPTLSAAQKSQDSTLTGWTTQINAGDTLRFNIDSVATITRLTLTLTVVL